jgi:lipopolysaccharide export system permease protein
MYRDSEMVIWFSSGRSLLSLFSPLLRFAWPVLVVVAALSLLVLPWANQQINELRTRFEKRGDIERITPGKFEESASGRRVFFIDKESNDSQTGSNVIISATERGRETITSARQGKVVLIGDERYVLLERGQRLEMSQDRQDLRVAEFSEFGVSIKDRPDTGSELPARSLSSLALLQSPSAVNLGELSWRVGLIVAALNFLVIAAAAASVNPRVGRGGGLMLALFAFITYFNLLNLGQNWISSGKVSLPGFMLGLHGGAFLVGVAWLVWRHHNLSLRWLLRTRLAPRAA